MSRHTSGTTAGPASAHDRVAWFTFAIRLAKTNATKAKRAAAVAEHLDEVPGAVVIDERPDGDRLWLTVAVAPPLRAAEAMRAAESCPEYVAGTFAGMQARLSPPFRPSPSGLRPCLCPIRPCLSPIRHFCLNRGLSLINQVPKPCRKFDPYHQSSATKYFSETVSMMTVFPLCKVTRRPWPLAAVVAACFAIVVPADAVFAAANNLLINASSDTNNISGTIGYFFAADDEIGYPRTAEALGFVDAGENGLATSHQVGLYHWNGSAYSLERSVTIGAGTAYYLEGGYRWYPIAGYSLTDTGATAYFLAATVASGDGDQWGGNGSANFTSIGNSFYNVNPPATGGSSTSSLLPAIWDGSFPGGTFYNAPNLSINPVVPVPEPSAYILALAGLTCGGYLKWRRRKRA